MHLLVELHITEMHGTDVKIILGMCSRELPENGEQLRPKHFGGSINKQ